MTTEALDVFPAPPSHDAPAAATAPAPLPDGPVARLELLVRDPDALHDALDRDAQRRDPDAVYAALARALLAAITLGGGVFGAVVGAHRGGLQVLWCTLKVPLLLVVTLVVCTPPFLALARAAGLALDPRRVVTIALASCARFALVLLGLAPFVWLMEGWSMGYHRVILAVVAVCGVAGFAASRVLFRGLTRAGAAGVRVGLGFVVVFALVGAQTSWILRPFVVRPRTTHVPFVRALEGDFLDAVATSARSAVVYPGGRDARAQER